MKQSGVEFLFASDFVFNVGFLRDARTLPHTPQKSQEPQKILESSAPIFVRPQTANFKRGTYEYVSLKSPY